MIRRRVLIPVVLLALLGVSGSLRAQTPGPVYPTLTQPVTDTAGVIDADSLRTLDRNLRALRAATNDVMAIVTVPTIEPAASVEEYAVKLFEQAGIGNRELDNGILILVAVKEHGIRIEVGYGLEGIVPDGFAGETIREAIVPEFKAGRYGAGLVAGSTRLIQKISAGRQADVEGIPAAPTGPPVWLFALIPFVIIGTIITVVVVLAKKGKIRKVAPGVWTTAGAASASGLVDDDWPGRRSDSNASSSSSSSASSSESSDSGGFDGGSSGGGGASGSW